MRRLLRRRIRAHERIRMFAAAVGILVLTAVVLAFISAPSTGPSSSGMTPAPASAVSSPESSSSAAPAAPTRTATPHSERSVRAVETAARAFLDGYLPYTYGQRDGSDVKAATGTLRRILVRNPP